MGLFGGGGDEGSSGMLRTVVTMAVFVAIFSLLLSYAAPIFYGSATSVSAGPSSFSVSDMAMINFAETDNGLYEYEITPADYGTFFNPPPDDLVTTDSLEYADGISDANRSIRFNLGDFYIWFLPIKDYDSKGDAFAFYAKSGWWDVHTAVFHKTDILNHLDPIKSRSFLSAQLGVSVNIYFQFDKDFTPAVNLDNRFNYNVSIGQSYINETRDKNNALNVLTGLLTFNLPAGGTGFPLFDVLLSTAFIASCGFILYWAITRII